MPVRCVENRVFAVTANRCGVEARTGEELAFTGRIVSGEEACSLGLATRTALEPLEAGAGVIRVLVTQDAPPSRERGKLAQSFRGWVLRPATGCMDYVARGGGAGGRPPRASVGHDANSRMNAG